MGKLFEGNLVGTGLKIAIAISRFNDTIGLELLRGAQTALRMHGVSEPDVDVAWAAKSARQTVPHFFTLGL